MRFKALLRLYFSLNAQTPVKAFRLKKLVFDRANVWRNELEDSEWDTDSFNRALIEPS